MPAGRPSEYTEEIADRICAELAQGNSLRTVCKAEDMPCKATVFNWLRKEESFLDQYTRAKDESADADADKLDSIAEDVLSGEVEPQAARVAADIIKWAAGKKRPKKYGDKIQTEHSGSIGMYDQLEAEELDRLIAEKQQALEQSKED